jgi:hypothetical protein
VFVDPARTGSVEKSTGSFRVWAGLDEKFRMTPSNVLRFDFEYGQSFDTAVVTTLPAHEASCVKSAQLLHPSIHFLIEASQIVQ